jgi:hypothetical protein
MTVAEIDRAAAQLAAAINAQIEAEGLIGLSVGTRARVRTIAEQAGRGIWTFHYRYGVCSPPCVHADEYLGGAVAG